MPHNLLARATGQLDTQVFAEAETGALLDAIQLYPGIKFDGRDKSTSTAHSSKDGATPENGEDETALAHRAGVNCLTIDRFEGRYMLSGGSDSSLILWDLEAMAKPATRHRYTPEGKAAVSPGSQTFGITHLSFYPFDSLAFLSSSYDHTLKMYASETLKSSASFNLESVVYNHAMSPIAEHLLVACATQHQTVRLVDLKSGACTHSLAGHHGAILSVAWSPRDEHILASSGSDGTVRLWDVRRSAGSLGVLDLEDSVGVQSRDESSKPGSYRTRGHAHIGPCNGVTWTNDGKFLVTAGHDEKVRVWDGKTGANMLSHFGPIVKNTSLSTLLPLLVPDEIGLPEQSVMFYPNEKEILMFDLFEGTLLKRLRPPGVVVAQATGSIGQRNIRNRTTSLVWKTGSIEMYSAHSDGALRAWKPKTEADMDVDQEDAEIIENSGDNDRKRKREALNEIFRDLTKQKITFT